MTTFKETQGIGLHNQGVKIPQRHLDTFIEDGITLNRVILYISREGKHKYIAVIPDTPYKVKKPRRTEGDTHASNITDGILHLPSELTEAASIDAKVAMVKIGDYMEIWNPEILEKHLHEHSYEEVAEKIRFS